MAPRFLAVDTNRNTGMSALLPPCTSSITSFGRRVPSATFDTARATGFEVSKRRTGVCVDRATVHSSTFWNHRWATVFIPLDLGGRDHNNAFLSIDHGGLPGSL